MAGSDLYFTFDHTFDSDASQSNIFDECVTDLVNSAFEGFNATIIAYGQTGSGKQNMYKLNAKIFICSYIIDDDPIIYIICLF